ncbi:hypothetical protein T310_1689 [Rasamsonia emersonii CBS 393.64]|uniref:Uncharacterized protein n=1 Tax=Rasamsonia emersonii (strain ATCC 16479 / CBS 393.64 / IMI 116815) TaxID=1408163 RepID=A0A0F4Z2F0_RASE3|nr:hypothetical protein T310_1689 [Rasamsonia emersonii CBS 393.64]KKA24256.1 hypothetical protein T310_1689 [Rasamsonia emersonii CBS 393.64]
MHFNIRAYHLEQHALPTYPQRPIINIVINIPERPQEAENRRLNRGFLKMHVQISLEIVIREHRVSAQKRDSPHELYASCIIDHDTWIRDYQEQESTLRHMESTLMNENLLSVPLPRMSPYFPGHADKSPANAVVPAVIEDNGCKGRDAEFHDPECRKLMTTILQWIRDTEPDKYSTPITPLPNSYEASGFINTHCP